MPVVANVFISYAREDQSFRATLDTHLALLKREGFISTWHDARIEAGADWAFEIERALSSSDVVVLLISSDFLNSDYCYNVELRKAMERLSTGAASVIPVLVRQCDWQSAPFSKLQIVPRSGVPIAAYASADEAWSEVANALRQAVGPRTETPQETTPTIQSPPRGDLVLERVLMSEMPRLFSTIVGPPGPILLRARVATHLASGSQAPIDQWTYVAEWIVRRGAKGRIALLRLFDEIQEEHYSFEISSFAARVVRIMLGGSGDGGGSDIAFAARHIAEFVRSEARRWRQIEDEATELYEAKHVSAATLEFAQTIARVWRELAGLTGRLPTPGSSSSVDTQHLFVDQPEDDQVSQEVALS